VGVTFNHRCCLVNRDIPRASLARALPFDYATREAAAERGNAF
jgi:hypothetical protein